MDRKDKINPYKIADEIASDFYHLLKLKYHNKEKCLIAELHSADFQILKDIIHKHIDALLKPKEYQL